MQITPLFKLDLYLMMLDPSVKLNETDASLQKLSIGNQKCDAAGDDANDTGVMTHMCQPCFAGDTKTHALLQTNHQFNFKIISILL